MSGDTWACTAYGPDGLRVGALCFVADKDQRRCPSRADCERVMHDERRRLYRRLQIAAAAGDELWASVLADIDGPDELLGGADPTP